MLETLKETILNPLWYIELGGLYLLLIVIFAETGLFVGFFLPGDSLLVVSGMVVDELAKEFFDVHFLVIPLLFSIAGILGNFVGYWFGKKSGTFLYERKDTFFFKKKHLLTAQKFYEKNGSFTIIVARFVPIVRTFAPIVAGIVKMDFKKFIINNIIGSFAWVFSLVLLGKYVRNYILEKYKIDLIDHIEIIVIVIVLVTTIPVIYKFISESRKHKKEDYND